MSLEETQLLGTFVVIIITAIIIIIIIPCP